jgi:two-component system, OmpR family, sensor histidine kinase CpxA
MRPGLPLSAKILLWFFLNLLLLVAIFYLFFRLQFRWGLDSLLAGPAGDRVQAIASEVGIELSDANRTEWDELLRRHGADRGVVFRLFRADGEQMAGEPVRLPAEVLQRFQSPRGAGPRTGPRNGPPVPEDEAPDPALRGGPEGQAGPPRNAAPRFMVKTDRPTQYWVGVRLPLTELSRPTPVRGLLGDGARGRAGGPMLLMTSATLTAGGLFFDATPWVVVLVAVVFVSVLFWWPMIRGITRSIARIDRATLEIAEGNFAARVEEGRRDELGRLGGSINQLATRLDGFVTGQKRFLGDIAHELCSPLARMQMALGILEQRADERQKDYVEDVREEVQHMSALVAELLSFSKAGLRGQDVDLRPVELPPIVDRVVERETSSSDRVELDLPDSLRVLAEPDLLARAIGNVLRNGLRYAGAAGPIVIRARRSGDTVVLTVRDQGPGVPEAAIPKLFDPFYRPDASRTSATGGVGLGLAIVKSCVEACQGQVSLRNVAPHGLEVELRLRPTDDLR